MAHVGTLVFKYADKRIACCSIAFWIGLLTCTIPVSAGTSSHYFKENLFLQTQLFYITEINPHKKFLTPTRSSGFELSNGRYFSLHRFYKNLRPDIRFDFLTRITSDAAFVWGISTGESGRKYHVTPTFRVGFIAQFSPSAASTISFNFGTAFGGRLREKSCIADYGAIGGVQEVNCRLAASVLPPAETLRFLWRERRPDETRVFLRYRVQF